MRHLQRCGRNQIAQTRRGRITDQRCPHPGKPVHRDGNANPATTDGDTARLRVILHRRGQPGAIIGIIDRLIGGRPQILNNMAEIAKMRSECDWANAEELARKAPGGPSPPL